MIGDLFKYWTYQVFSPGTILREKYEAFRSLLEYDQLAHESMAELQRISYEELPVDASRVHTCYANFSTAVANIVDHLSQMCPGCYSDLKVYHTKFDQYIRYLLAPSNTAHSPENPYTLALSRETEYDSDLVGGKAEPLIKILKKLQLPVPKGFIITTNAFWYLIEHNRLRPIIDTALARIHPDEPSAIVSVSEELSSAMMEMEIPSELEAAILNALKKLQTQCGDYLQLAVRSSALGEDSDTSHAGQYRSCLQVKPENVFQAYRHVLASKFEPTALYYRIRSGMEDGEAPMAVLVMEMIDPTFSGVLYTRGPTPEKTDITSIHYVEGFGEALVSGDRKARVISFTHNQGDITKALDVNAASNDDVPLPLLDVTTVTHLAQWAVQLEDLHKAPCDVEWCLEKSGRLYLLQCRPLLQQQAPHQPPKQTALEEDSTESKLLFKGGLCACAGMGSGPVYKINSDTDLIQIPQNSVAVLKTSPPHFVPILDRVSAVIVEQGSVAGHFQTVAREFNVPTLVDVKDAGKKLKQGELVTVDAGSLKIVAGYSTETAAAKLNMNKKAMDNPLHRKLKAAMSFITPLKLLDPRSPSFLPQSCRSMHDIIRFAHEKAVYEMFAIGDRRLKRKKGARKLIGELPMVIYVLDVGGGIQEEQSQKQSIKIEDISCQPMHALWQGLLHPDIQWAGHSHFDWAEYDRLVMNGGIISPESAMLSSYAVVADRYLNFCLKFGYHFAIIDALFQKPPQTGHIWFRFTGGGGDPQGRVLRVRFIERVLETLGFSVKTEGELINARCDEADDATFENGLVRIGHLLGVTRLMDMHLKDETTVDHLVDLFAKEQFKDFIWEEGGDG